jgi:hypothetical protein
MMICGIEESPCIYESTNLIYLLSDGSTMKIVKTKTVDVF